METGRGLIFVDINAGVGPGVLERGFSAIDFARSENVSWRNLL